MGRRHLELGMITEELEFVGLSGGGSLREWGQADWAFIDVASFSLLTERRARAPQSSHQFDRAAASRAGIQVPNVAPEESVNIRLLAHDTLLLHKNLLSFFNLRTPFASFMLLNFRGCATLSNKDTVEPDLHVKSTYMPADKACCSGWALEAVSKARFRRIPRNGRSSIAHTSLHCHRAVAKKRSIALTVLSAVRTAAIEERGGRLQRCKLAS